MAREWAGMGQEGFCHSLMQSDSVGLANGSILLQHGQTRGVCVGGYRVETSKPSYAQLAILFIPAALLAAYLDVGSLGPSVDLKLPLWLKVVWSYYIATMLHITTMGLLGTLWLKVPIERMAFGFGKRLLLTNIAGIPISLGIVPLGGYVRFSGNDPKCQGWRRSVIELSGCTVLLALATVIMGQRANFDVLAIWKEFVEGALSPFGYAQTLLMDLGRYLAGLDAPSTFSRCRRC
jgi:hypothetical protein